MEYQFHQNGEIIDTLLILCSNPQDWFPLEIVKLDAMS